MIVPVSQISQCLKNTMNTSLSVSIPKYRCNKQKLDDIKNILIKHVENLERVLVDRPLRL